MRHCLKPTFWKAGVAVGTLLVFLAGAGLACFQKGALAAEECCLKHCQHAVVGSAAAKCCKKPPAKLSGTLPVFSPAKTLSLTAYPLHVFLIPPAVLQGQGLSWVRSAHRGPVALFPPFYTLHCTLLI